MTSRAAARRYARALFDVVLAEGSIERAQAELQSFADLVAGSDALTKVFANPAIPAARKRGVVAALLQRTGMPAGPVSKLVQLLADRDRLVILPEVARAYRERVMDHQNIVRGVVMIGKENADNRRAIERYGGIPVIGAIPWLDIIDRATLRGVFQQRFDGSVFE